MPLGFSNFRFEKALPHLWPLWVIAIAFLFPVVGRAGTAANVGERFAQKFEDLRGVVQHGQWDVYATGYAWHLPWSYSDATRARLNETTWGGGIGRSLWTNDLERHSVFMLSFSDSHRTPQHLAGFGWHRYRPMARSCFLGWGYFAFLFSREDVAGRFPLPGVLPSVSIRYRHWELLGLYIPPVTRDIKGDVLYVFARVSL